MSTTDIICTSCHAWPEIPGLGVCERCLADTDEDEFTEPVGNILSALTPPAPQATTNGTKKSGLLEGVSDIDRFMAALLTDEELERMPPPEWLIEGLLVRNSLGVLFGASGGYKTFVALSWMLAVATGSWWFGRKVHQGPVLMIAAEGAVGLGRRIAAWKEREKYYGGAGLLVYPEPVNLLDRAQGGVVAKAAERIGAALVVIDTVSRSMDGGDENTARDMNVLVAAADQIRRASGACVLPIHHTGKDTERGLRGSNTLFAGATTVIECQGKDLRLTLSHRKQKEDELADDLRMGLMPSGDSLVVTEHPAPMPEGTGEEARAMLAVLDEIADDDGVSAGLWFKALGQGDSVLTMSDRTFRRHVKKLCEDGHADKHGKGNQARYTLSEQGRWLIGP